MTMRMQNVPYLQNFGSARFLALLLVFAALVLSGGCHSALDAETKSDTKTTKQGKMSYFREYPPVFRYRFVYGSMPYAWGTRGYNYAVASKEESYPWWYDHYYWQRNLKKWASIGINGITFWHPHPFPGLIKFEGSKFPKAAILSDKEIDKNISLFKWLTEEAEKYDIKIYLITWNIWTSPNLKEYGANSGMDNEVTREYMRYCIEELFRTYPKLAGLGCTIGEHPPRNYDFVKATYPPALEKAKKYTGRYPLFILRSWLIFPSQAKELIDSYKGKTVITHKLQEVRPEGVTPIADPRIEKWHKATGAEIIGHGQPQMPAAFIRDIAASLLKQGGSGIIVNDGTHVAAQASQVFGYNPRIPYDENYWIKKTAEQYKTSLEGARHLFKAQEASSLATNRLFHLLFHGINWFLPQYGVPLYDYLGRPTLRQGYSDSDKVTNKGLFKVNWGFAQTDKDLWTQEDIISIRDYVLNGMPDKGTTPLQIADELENYARNALKELEVGKSYLNNPCLDWIEITLPEVKAMDKVVVYTSINNGPRAGGLRDYQLQYWDGKQWALLDNIEGNTKDVITHKFVRVDTNKIRLWITASNKPNDDYSRVVEIEVYDTKTGVNHALANNGAKAAASSEHNSGRFPASLVIDGRKPYPAPFWNDDTKKDNVLLSRIRLACYNALHYSEKIRGAVAWYASKLATNEQEFRKYKGQAVAHLSKSIELWDRVCELSDGLNPKPQYEIGPAKWLHRNQMSPVFRNELTIIEREKFVPYYTATKYSTSSKGIIHTRITDLADGYYTVYINDPGSAMKYSFDGKNWQTIETKSAVVKPSSFGVTNVDYTPLYGLKILTRMGVTSKLKEVKVKKGKFDLYIDSRNSGEYKYVRLAPTYAREGINLASASLGAKAVASSEHQSGRFSASLVTDGEKYYPAQSGFWNDDTINSFPDWIEVTLPIFTSINKVVVYTVTNKGRRTAGLRDYQLQYWNGQKWVLLDNIKGNTKEVITHNFTRINTSRIRLWITASNKPADDYSRVVEIEVYNTGYTAKAFKTNISPKIDGVIEEKEWSKASPVYLKSPEVDAKDCSAAVYTLWDNKYLYLLVKVTDNAYVNGLAGNSMWNGDCIEVGFSMPGDKWVKYLFAKTPKGDECFLRPECTRAKSVNYAIKLAETGYVLEARFPFGSDEIRGFTPREGLEIGFNLAIDDADNLVRDKQITWQGDVNRSHEYGKLRFIKNKKQK